MLMSNKGWVIPRDSFLEKATQLLLSLYFHIIFLGCLWIVLNQEKVHATTVGTIFLGSCHFFEKEIN